MHIVLGIVFVLLFIVVLILTVCVTYNAYAAGRNWFVNRDSFEIDEFAAYVILSLMSFSALILFTALPFITAK
jgi:hypothetical protein